jgi:hypothetical protein
MPRTAPVYEKPSRISQGLVVCFSIAVVVMAGWLVTVVMFFDGANTMAADKADIQPISTRPYVMNVSPEPAKLGETAPSNSADLEPSPWVHTPDSATPPAAPAPPRSDLPLAPFAEFPAGGAPRPAYAMSSVATGVPDASYRGTMADDLSRQVEAAIDADTAADVVPLPLPKPRPSSASIPVPRPRPRLDAEDTQPSPDQSFFEFLVNRPR